MAPSEQQIFKRIMTLTLIQGIFIGLQLALAGLALATLTFHSALNFLLAFPQIVNITGPLTFFFFGTLLLLQSKRQALRHQLLAPSQLAVGSDVISFLVFGLLSMGLGSLEIIAITIPSVAVVWPVAFFVGLLGSCAVIWYLQCRSHRRTPQP